MVLPPAAQARVVGFSFPPRSPGCVLLWTLPPSDSSCAMAAGGWRAELKPVSALSLVTAQSKLRGHDAGSGPVCSPWA